ncbi:DUF5107 domain-containing protein [Nonomuraea soli]|uniref:Tetratricopeptide (TPR) repeat protein n=1 Tax=Nonomuraea soli TaxID=1032476 RepID=A0A7W0HP02_9ACTN|nr:DUF5107 domain-containing protein [Nonomuraea soli]MBA2890348.1 tetratricopeptide (TPR) repeat protein [Nonomuraea soli]
MTTTVRQITLRMPVARVGPDNPLPPLGGPGEVHTTPVPADVPGDMAFQLGYGRLASVLPYLVQDGYGRVRQEREVEALELGNGRLTATILPGLGGRLASLVHRDHGELLYRNPVLQPANFGLTGAWFSGGVEWNSGSTGHTAQSCRPLFAARLPAPDGTPMVRLWEWERTRDLPYQVDFWLPDDGDFLFVGVRVRNPHDHEVPAYWWSNIAVPESEDTRVLAPAERAWHFGYAGRLHDVPIPAWEGLDRSYPARAGQAADYFFELEERRRWIAALDGSGRGLVQTSTAVLRGRKLFLWGRGAGGRRWQEWLTEPGTGGYLEIQAGLARTQLEHVPLPGGEAFSWLEAYGPLEADARAVHGDDWGQAVRAAEDALERRLPAVEVDAAYKAWLGCADRAPAETLAAGSGWGALEVARTGAATPGTPFPALTLGPEQEPWRALLATGAMPDSETGPGPSLVSAGWRRLLERAPRTWTTAYHLGVALWHRGDREAAERAWRRSIALRPTPWALRCLAIATGESGLYLEALESASEPLYGALALEGAQALLAAGQADRALDVLATLPHTGRVNLLRARALIAQGDTAAARAIFDAGFEVTDLREGESALHETWAALTGEPLPERYDFRMHPEA